jgi:hypothetical protein
MKPELSPQEFFFQLIAMGRIADIGFSERVFSNA